jgi:hypothetical protein
MNPIPSSSMNQRQPGDGRVIPYPPSSGFTQSVSLHKSQSDNNPTVPTPYQTQLQYLHEMGFYDDQKNLILLKKYKGNISDVVGELTKK